jgi:hypothetical protein
VRTTATYGVVFFKSFDDARTWAVKHAQGYPAWRVIPYENGYSVEMSPGGGYLANNGKPAKTGCELPKC